MRKLSEGMAWVVTWSSTAHGRTTLVSRPYTDDREAREASEFIGAHLPVDEVRVDYLPDLTVEEVYPAFMAAFGGEVRPHVVRVFNDEGESVDVYADPDEVLHRAYVEVDPADDRNFPHMTTTPHPRRLGVIWLASDLEEQFDSGGTVADVRGQ